MKAFDRLTRRMRFRVVRPHIPPGSRVLDVGCGGGEIFRTLADKKITGIGIDPSLNDVVEANRYRLLPGRFPEALPRGELFEVVTMLAVLEHIPRDQHHDVARACYECLRPGGLVIITVPSPLVDVILSVLQAVGVSEPVELEQHYGFHPSEAPEVFGERFTVYVDRRFELGLNRLFVFRKRSPPAPSTEELSSHTDAAP